MDDQALFDLVPSIRIYARVTPAHKQRIIKALQQHDQIVAMTGDGINDAPALKAADIGIAMGINGTEVTKDAADFILLDDRFTTIEHSVEAGRTIFANIKNFMRHELTTNVAEVLALTARRGLDDATSRPCSSNDPSVISLNGVMGEHGVGRITEFCLRV
jgi:Ca2+-transporting ATPase